MVARSFTTSSPMGELLRSFSQRADLNRAMSCGSERREVGSIAGGCMGASMPYYIVAGIVYRSLTDALQALRTT